MPSTNVERSVSAFLYDELEYYEDAIRECTAHLGDSPNCVPALNNRAILYWEIGDHDNAAADFLRATERTTMDSLPCKNYGLFLEQKGQHQSAIEQYRRGLNISPDDASLNRCMAFALVQLHQDAEAIHFFSQAIHADRRFKRTYLDRAAAYDRVGSSFRARLDRLIARWL